MVYKKYGMIFKDLRIHSGFTLSYFSCIGIPCSTLSDFERGRSMMSFDKIDSALQLMGYSLSDYDSYLNQFRPADTINLLQKAEEAFLKNDMQKLRVILETFQQNNQSNISLALQLALGENKKIAIEEITNILYDTPVFGKIELSLFYVLIPFISPKDILNIIHVAEDVGRGMTGDRSYHRRIAHVVFEIILILSYYQLETDAKYYLKRVEKSDITQSMFLKNLFYGVKGFYLYQFDNKAIGKEMINRCLEIMDFATQPEIANFYKKKFKRLMN